MKFTGPWTHSKLADFEKCKLQFKLKHIDKLSQGTSPALERGSAIHEMIEGYVSGWVKTLDKAVVGLRKELAALKKDKPMVEALWAHDRNYRPLADMWTKDAWCRAKLDAMVDDGKTVRVIDFKTGRMYPSNEDQVRFYAMLGLSRSPTAQWAKLELWYVDQDALVAGDATVTRDDIPKLAKDYTRRAERMYKATTFTAEPGYHCRTCPYRRSNGGPCEF